MTIEERLEKLERELSRAKRRIRWLLAGGLCLGIVALVWAFGLAPTKAQAAGSAPKEVRAKSFILEDENGKSRASLEMHEGGPWLILVGERGTGSAFFGINELGPGLRLCNEEGNPLAGLNLPPNEGPNLELRDKKGKMRTDLAMTEDGPALRLYGENGKARVSLFVHDKAGIALSDEDGKVRSYFGVTQNMPSMFLYDENGEARFSLAVLKGVPHLSLFDEKGNRLPIR